MTNLLFVEFAEGKPVEVLRTGTFVDRSGRKVTIAGEDLDAYVSNFESGAAGQDVPIDIQHEKAEAAGWIRRLWREADRLLADPEWNELGQQLVGDKVYKYVSATIDLAKKVIRSVSLVNFPAVKGLAPVELSEGVYGFQEDADFWERIVASIRKALKPSAAEAGESEFQRATRAVKISDYLQAKIHRAFTTLADDMAAGGLLTVEERIQLSAAIGEALDAFRANAGEAGEREVQVPEPEWIFYREAVSEAEAGEQPQESGEDDSMSGKQKEADGPDAPPEETPGGVEMSEEERAQVREEIREELLSEMTEKEQLRTELMDEVREEVEAEMAEKFERRKALTEFAEEITGGDSGLSAKAEDIVSTLEGLDDDTAEAVKVLLKSKVVDFSERGSSREGKGGKKELDSGTQIALAAWVEQGQGIAEFFELNSDILGEMDSYDLSEFEKEE